MPVSALYNLHSVAYSSPLSLTYKQITNATIDGQAQVRMIWQAGAVYPTMAAIDSAAPLIRFTTTQLQDLLATVVSFGDGIAVNTSGGNVVLTLQKVTEFGNRSSAPDSITWTIADSMMFWETITAPNGAPATADISIVAAFDGTNAPIAYGTTTAVNTGVADEEFKLGPVELNGSALGGVQRVRIASGAKLMVSSDQSNPYPDFLAVGREDPTIALELSDATEWGTVGFSATSLGAALSSSGLEVYLRRVLDGSTFVANATAVHIKAQIADGLIYPDTLNVPEDDRAMLSLMAKGRGADSETNPLSLGYLTAIT